MTDKLRLSVVIPNRNHAALLPRALAALQRQSRQADEIIVIDDESTDDSRAVMHALAPTMPTLRILENARNLGAVGTINRGIAEATGDVVYCGAADDETAPELFSSLMAAMERHPQAGLACAEARVVDEEAVDHGLRPICLPRYQPGYVSAQQTASMLRGMDNWILSVVAIYRLAPLREAGGLDQSLGAFSDSFVARRLALRHGFVFVPRVLGTWYVQRNSYSRRTARDPAMLASLLETARGRIEAEATLYPRSYAATFERRARFGAARLAVQDSPDDLRLIADLAGPGRSSLPPLLRCADLLPRALRQKWMLLVLTVLLRPMSLSGLLMSRLYRRWRNSDGARTS